MPDHRDRNGHDDSAPLLQVVVPTHRPPIARVDVKPASYAARAGGNALQIHIDDTVMALVPTVNTSAERIDAVYLQLIVLSNAFNDLARRLTDTRAKVASSHDLAETSQQVVDAAGKVEAAVEKLDEFAAEHTNPDLHPGETDSQRFARHRKQERLAEAAAKWDEHEAQAKKDKDDAAAARRQLKVGVAIGVLVLVIATIGGFVWHATTLAATKALDEQRAVDEHEKGVAEGRAASPVMVVPVPAPPSSLEPAVTMPAATAAARRRQ